MWSAISPGRALDLVFIGKARDALLQNQCVGAVIPNNFYVLRCRPTSRSAETSETNPGTYTIDARGF